MNLGQTLIRPVLTEKSVAREVQQKYTFVVHDEATKIDVRNALHSLYGVAVEKVNILHTLPKYRMGKGKNLLEKRQGTRRAIVTLKEGQKLDLTQGTHGAERSAPTKKETTKSSKSKTAA